MLNLMNLGRNKGILQTLHMLRMRTTMKSLPLVGSILRAPSDEINDPYHQSVATNLEQDVRRLQHMYQVKELTTTSKESTVNAKLV